MNILKDIIGLNIFIFSLLVLYQTTNHLIALITVIALSVFYVIKHFKLNHFIKKELQGQIQVFETLFNSSSDVIVYLDLSLHVIACNKALTEDFGMSSQELIGEPLKKLFEAKCTDPTRLNKIWKRLQSCIDKAAKSNKPVKMEDEYYAKNGILSSYNLIISPTVTSDGKKNGTILVARNVTQERLATKKAIEKENQLKCILENMPICAYMKDKNDRFITGSSAFEEYVCTNAHVEQLNLSDIYDENYLKLIKEEEEVVYKTKKIIDSERQVILPNQSFWGRVRKVPVLDDTGEVKYLVVMYENIESEKEVERQKEYFIETLIHDLKIPTLAQLRGLELIKSGAFGKHDSEEIDLISQIESSCKYILEMISMVLNTYRYENGQNNLYIENFSLAELLLKCFAEISDLTREKNLMLTYAASLNDTYIDADKSAIKIVILNLLSNAITYSDKNKKILVNIEKENNQLKLTVTSYGIVLSDRERTSLFDRAAIKSPKYTTIGSGIGLYLCKKIVDVHNGKIFASTDGNYSNSVSFILPIHANIMKPQKPSPLFI